MLKPAAVVWIPGTPLLVPEVATGARGDVAVVREASIAALRGTLREGGPVVVVAADTVDRAFPAGAGGSLAGLGLSRGVTIGEPVPGGVGAPREASDHAPGSDQLPLGAVVGVLMIEDAVGLPPALPRPTIRVWGLDVTGASSWVPPEPAGDWTLVVVADGSTTRTSGDPGTARARSESWDRALSLALGRADLVALGALDAATAAEVGCRDVQVFRWVAAHVDGGWSPQLLRHDAPLGVGYLVATWRRVD